MAADPTLVTLAYLPSLAAVSSASYQKRSRVITTEREAEIEDTRAFGSGDNQEANALGAADLAPLPPQGLTGEGDGEIFPKPGTHKRGHGLRGLPSPP